MVTQTTKVVQQRTNAGLSRVNERTKRKQINMSERAWDKLDQLSDKLGWSRSRTLEFILQKVMNQEVKIHEVITHKSGQENLKVDRIQRGLFFLRETNEYLSQTIRKEHKISMSNFLEQIVLHDDLLELYGFDLDNEAET